MIMSDLCRALLLLAFLAVQSENELWIIYVIATLESAISQFFVLAENAFLRRLVYSADLVQANSLNSLGQSLARLVAPTLGGALYASLGLPSVVIFDSASFLVSALLLAMIIESPAATGAPNLRITTTSPGAPAQRLISWREWLEGLSLVRHAPILSGIFLVWAIGMTVSNNVLLQR